jgi:hypothetical protein
LKFHSSLSIKPDRTFPSSEAQLNLVSATSSFLSDIAATTMTDLVKFFRQPPFLHGDFQVRRVVN